MAKRNNQMKQYLKLLRESYPLKNPMPTETILHELLHLPEESLEGETQNKYNY